MNHIAANKECIQALLFLVASFKCSNCPLGECLVVSHVGYEKCAALGFKLRILPSSLFSSDKVLFDLLGWATVFVSPHMKSQPMYICTLLFQIFKRRVWSLRLNMGIGNFQTVHDKVIF